MKEGERKLEQETHKYDDMLSMSHHKSKKYPHMSFSDRAAQFSPFAALTGHEDAIKETARLTDVRIELDEDQKVILDEKMTHLAENVKEQPQVTVTYFLQDRKKEGGEYVTVSGKVKKVDATERTIVLTDGTVIPVEDILEIDSIK